MADRCEDSQSVSAAAQASACTSTMTSNAAPAGKGHIRRTSLLERFLPAKYQIETSDTIKQDTSRERLPPMAFRTATLPMKSAVKNSSKSLLAPQISLSTFQRLRKAKHGDPAHSTTNIHDYPVQAMISMPELGDIPGLGTVENSPSSTRSDRTMDSMDSSFLTPSASNTPPARPRHSRRWSAFGRSGNPDDGAGNKSTRKHSMSGLGSHSVDSLYLADHRSPRSSNLTISEDPSPLRGIIIHQPKDLAMYLCVRDKETFGRIEPEEFFDCTWSGSEKHSKSPNIMSAIEEGNALYMLVVSEILAFEKSEERARAIEWFIKVAAYLNERNNFNSLKMVLCGLQCQSVHRLKKTWSLVSERWEKKFRSLQTLMSEEKNYSCYREQLTKTSLPKLPYLGVYLTDFTMLSDAKKNCQDRSVATGKLVTQFRDMVSASHYKGEVKVDFNGFLAEAETQTEEEMHRRSLALEQKQSTTDNSPAPVRVNMLVGSTVVDGPTLRAELRQTTKILEELRIRVAQSENDEKDMDKGTVESQQMWDLTRHATYLNRQIDLIAKEPSTHS